MKRLELEAATRKAQLVTTEKDAVRLPPALRTQVLSVPVRLDIQDWPALEAAFQAAGISDSDPP